jgi:hypothetical protein
MKPATFLFASLLLAPQPACKVLLYPAARAFGAPSERDLKACRLACERLKASPAAARLVVFPARNPVRVDPQIGPDSASLLLAKLQAGGFGNAVLATADPGLPVTPYGGNQLRYSWDRARAYGAWIKQARPEGEFFFFAEVAAGPSGRVNGLHAYVLDAEGTVAYHRLMNSHHFGQPGPAGQAEALELLVKHFLKDLPRPALELFPKWGVG